MRRFCFLLPVAALAASFLASPVVRGAEKATCVEGAAHVTVAFEGEFSEEVKTGVLSDLSASLGPQQMSACPRSSEGHPKAVAALRLTRKSGGLVRIDVEDTLTSKRVSRDVTVRATSEGSTALILAVAADELLRATWAELSLKKRSEGQPGADQAGGNTTNEELSGEPKAAENEPKSAPKPSDIEAREETKTSLGARARLPWGRIGASAALDVFPSASPFFGADIFIGGRIGDGGEWTVLVGPRFSKERKASALGGSEAKALSVQGQGLWPIVRGPSVVFGPTASIQYLSASFQGTSGEEDVRASRANGWALVARGGALVRVHFGVPYVGLSADWGGAVRGFRVTDGSNTVGGMTGFVFSSGLFAGGAFGR